VAAFGYHCALGQEQSQQAEALLALGRVGTQLAALAG
jgi:hypothetical protein